MAHFYGDIQGNEGVATQTGSTKSGITGHIRGWHTGVKVVCYHDGETGKDTVEVYKTGGSARYESDELIATWKERWAQGLLK